MGYRVIPMRLEEHREVLVELWRRNLGCPAMETCADRRVAWLYEENPCGPAQTWLAVETETNQVIGCASVAPSTRYVHERPIRIGTAIDFTVAAQHRTAGAALALQRALTGEGRRAGFDCLVGKPNSKAFPVLSRIGYRRVGDCRNWVKPLLQNPETDEWADPRYLDERVSAADERFDRLWNSVKARGPVGEKTAAYLNWRYLAFKELNYELYCLVHRSDRRLAGYVVYARMDKGAFIAELLCEDLSGPIVEDLLLGFASRMRREGQGWIAVSYAGAPSFDDRLRQLGFSARKNARPFVAYLDAPASFEFRPQVFDTHQSPVFAGEMDLF
jgi:hypothetical protein